MLIKITARGFRLTDALREYINTRLHFTLGRFCEHLGHIEVTLLDINGPRGGEDMRCRLQLKPMTGRSIIVQETADDLYDAVAICASRARWVIGRQLEKIQEKKRRLTRGFSAYHYDIEAAERFLLGSTLDPKERDRREIEHVS